MVISSATYDGGVSVLNQEFNSFAACEKARKTIEKLDGKNKVIVRSQGCFEK